MAAPLGQEDTHDRIQAAGKNLLLYAFSLMKTGEVHELNNEAWIRPAEKLVEALDPLIKIERQTITFVVHEGVAQINSHALWLDRSTQDQAQELEQQLARREAGGFIFTKKPDDAELRRFFYLFARYRPPADAQDQMAALVAKLTEDGIEDIKVAPRPLRLEGVGQGVRGVAALWHYAKAVAGIGDLLRRTPVEIKAARRVAQELVDACAVEQDLLFALPLLARDRSAAHAAVDAAVIAAGFGRGLGLSAIACADLATAALLGRVGEAYANPDPDHFTAAEAAAVAAVRQLDDGGRFTPLLARRVVAAVEARLGPDGQGPPYLVAAPRPRPTSQLVALIEHYLGRIRGDAERPPASPLEVALALAHHPPPHIDPAMARVFVAVVGLFPVGTVVELHNGDLAVVADIDHLRGRHLYRKTPAPVTQQGGVWLERLRDAQGKVIPERRARVRLGDEGEAGEWTIRRTLAPDAHRDLIVRALVRRPSTVVAQLGLR
ncbi:MAG: hypothetical protein R3F65_04280 [bacterium]